MWSCMWMSLGHGSVSIKELSPSSKTEGRESDRCACGAAIGKRALEAREKCTDGGSGFF